MSNRKLKAKDINGTAEVKSTCSPKLDIAPPAKQMRGRPKKTDAQGFDCARIEKEVDDEDIICIAEVKDKCSPELEAGPPTKRMRGRPKKVYAQGLDSAKIEKEGDAEDINGAAEVKSTCLLPKLEVAPPVKRMRGRPKKTDAQGLDCARIEKEVDDDDISCIAEVEGKSSPKLEADPPTKRMRGRPKKIDVQGLDSTKIKKDLDDEDINGAAEVKSTCLLPKLDVAPLVKQMRGRPKKTDAQRLHCARIEKEVDDEDISFIAEVEGKSSPKLEADPPTKRMRGRPKKIDVQGLDSTKIKKYLDDEDICDTEENKGKHSPQLEAAPPPKRMRGRPKKTAAMGFDCPTIEKEVDDEDIKSTCSPKLEVAPPAKQMRGRPKKTDRQRLDSSRFKKEVDDEDINCIAEVKDKCSPELEAGPPTKRRGRPKKVDAQEFDSAQIEKEVDAEEKSIIDPNMRGRPKRESARISSDATAIIMEEDEKDEETKLEQTQEITKFSKAKNSKKVTTKKKDAERTLVKKGIAAVDALCPIADSSHIYIEGDDIWDCMLNQTNIQFNNNKYYIIQLLKDDQKAAYSVWMRWGRVGATGQNCLKPCASNLELAKSIFKKKFSDKSKNDWECRENFVKVPGKYDLLKMDYSNTPDDVDSQEDPGVKPPVKKKESQLEVRVKALIELICDVKAMEETVIQMKYDAKKAPLGKLTPEQVKAGYAALKDIETIILGEKASNRDLVEACNAFYTRIPHSFGMKVPPLIRTTAEIREKLSLLQALSDIQAAMVIISQPRDRDLAPVDQHHRDLNCDIIALNKNEPEFDLVNRYMKTTHGVTHSYYKMELLEVFRVTRSLESTQFQDVGNRMLLWHGSRLTNWAGILSKGLRIAPPEAPWTGYMFGKGIYFADMASKSANYCMPSPLSRTGLLVLCDVSLGNCNKLINANYQGHKLPKGCQSVKGLGRLAPQSKNYITQDELSIPMGPAVETDVNNKNGYTLQYNEYVVYDVSQVKIKYLLKINFNFK